MQSVLELLAMWIDWEKTSESPYCFRAEVNGEEIRLRLNDFPEEPLCTLTRADGDNHLDDLGTHWTLPKHRGEE